MSLERSFRVLRKTDSLEDCPSFPINAKKEIVPKLILPMNFQKVIPIFYAEGGKQKIEDYSY